jgi:hypothetical protein
MVRPLYGNGCEVSVSHLHESNYQDMSMYMSSVNPVRFSAPTSSWSIAYVRVHPQLNGFVDVNITRSVYMPSSTKIRPTTAKQGSVGHLNIAEI